MNKTDESVQILRRISFKQGEAAFPESVHGVTLLTAKTDDHEDYVVLINSGLDSRRKAATFLHEALHIFHGDFDDHRSVKEIEAERRAELRELLQILIRDDEENDDKNGFYGSADAEDLFYGRYHLHSIATKKEPPVCVAGDSQGRTENAEVGLNNSARTFHYSTEV